MFNFRSIRSKLFVVLLLIALIPVILSSAIFFYNSEKGYSSVMEDEQETAKHFVQSQFKQVANELLELTKIYASSEEVIEAYKTGDREKLAEVVDPTFSQLKTEHHLDVFEFGAESGVVFFRGHNPEKHGDDKSDKEAIQTALNGGEVAGLEFGSSGLAVRAFVPIKDGETIIGTLQTGVDGGFLQNINNSLKGVELSLYNLEGEVLISSNEKNVGKKLGNDSLLTRVLTGKEQSTEADDQLHSFVPMYDPTNSEVIGMIGISQDMSHIQQLQNDNLIIVLILLGITFVVVFVLALLVSRNISSPITQMNKHMGEIAKGNLMTSFEGKSRSDELGTLMESMKTMQDSLKTMVQHMGQVSENMKKQSFTFTNTSSDISEGMSQIAVTMQELSTGADTQSNVTVDLNEKVSLVAGKIHEANIHGKEVTKNGKEVLTITNSGSEQMAGSVSQMNIVREIFEDSYERIEDLENQSSEISKLVHVIKGIADQTNLLALNAAIEASRAGEHGRGFAVVADEVRKLAEQVSHSIGDITRIVEGIQVSSKKVTLSLKDGLEKVHEGSEQFKVTGETFERITESVSKMVEGIEGISANLTNIHTETNVINESVVHIASVTEESAAGIEQTSASVQQTSSSMEQIATNAGELSNISEELSEIIRKFTV